MPNTSTLPAATDKENSSQIKAPYSQVEINHETYSVTLVRVRNFTRDPLPFHAQLIIEGVGDHGIEELTELENKDRKEREKKRKKKSQNEEVLSEVDNNNTKPATGPTEPWIKLVHLVASAPKSPYNGSYCYPSTSTETIEFLHNLDATKVESKVLSKYTWKLSKNAVIRMLQDIVAEKKKLEAPRIDEKPKAVRFNIFGHSSLFNLPARLAGVEHDSCMSWARNKLLIAGVNLPVDMVNVATVTNEFTKPNSNTVPYDIKNLLHFAKHNDATSIRAIFMDPNNGIKIDPNLNIDKAIYNKSIGPVEAFLGKYNPLMIACAYRQPDAVKALIEMKANCNVVGGRKNDFTALDCVLCHFPFSENVSPSVNDGKIEKEIIASLITAGAKPHDEVRFIFELAKRGHGDLLAQYYLRQDAAGRKKLKAIVDDTRYYITDGPAEGKLGRYTPVMLAVAYGHLNAVKALVEIYKADIQNLKIRGTLLCPLTALDCAHYDFGIKHEPGTMQRILTYLLTKGAASKTLPPFIIRTPEADFASEESTTLSDSIPTLS